MKPNIVHVATTLTMAERGLTLLVLDQMSRASRRVGAGEVRRIVLDRDIALGPALLRLFDAAAGTSS